MRIVGRRSLLLGASALAALAVAGCDSGGRAGGLSPDDMTLGNPDSGVTLIEYGSSMCGHCREFHEAVWDHLKTNYIDTGRIQFVFREMLTPVDPQNVIPTIALAEYQLARCGSASPEQYFSRLGVMFEQQPEMFQAGSQMAVEAKLVEIGAASGLSREAVLACINDAEGQARIRRLGELSNRDGVTGTPTFFLNGELIETNSIMTPEGISAVLDAAIAQAGND
jgi:protein-disulfide isomerase